MKEEGRLTFDEVSKYLMILRPFVTTDDTACNAYSVLCKHLRVVSEILKTIALKAQEEDPSDSAKR